MTQLNTWGLPNTSATVNHGGAPVTVRTGNAALYPHLRTKDGFVRLVILAPRQWQAIWQWMGSPEELSDPFWATTAGRMQNLDVLNPIFEEFFAMGVRRVCDRYGVRLVFDEVVSAFRTGRFLAAHHDPDARPDAVALAKGLGAARSSATSAVGACSSPSSSSPTTTPLRASRLIEIQARSSYAMDATTVSFSIRAARTPACLATGS